MAVGQELCPHSMLAIPTKIKHSVAVVAMQCLVRLRCIKMDKSK